MSKVEQNCLRCERTYLDLIDVVEIEGDDVQFLACFACQKGYTRYGKQMEMIV